MIVGFFAVCDAALSIILYTAYLNKTAKTTSLWELINKTPNSNRLIKIIFVNNNNNK